MSPGTGNPGNPVDPGNLATSQVSKASHMDGFRSGNVGSGFTFVMSVGVHVVTYTPVHVL